MFNAKVPNSMSKFESSSIKAFKTKGLFISSFKLKAHENGCMQGITQQLVTLNWFTTQAMSTRYKMYTIIYNICHLKGGGTQPMILGIICVLTKDNDFSKLKSFLRHDHFACKFAPIKFPIAWKISIITRFKTIGKNKQLAFYLV